MGYRFHVFCVMDESCISLLWYHWLPVAFRSRRPISLQDSISQQRVRVRSCRLPFIVLGPSSAPEASPIQATLIHLAVPWSSVSRVSYRMGPMCLHLYGRFRQCIPFSIWLSLQQASMLRKHYPGPTLPLDASHASWSERPVGIDVASEMLVCLFSSLQALTHAPQYLTLSC
jgi:hypothetical protein